MSEPSQTRCPAFHLFAVMAAVGFAAFAVAVAVARQDRVALPGALSAFAIYSVLGCFIVRGHQWARWTLFAFAVLTALTSFIGVALPPHELRGSLLILAAAVYFGLIAAALAARRCCPRRAATE